jgi:hypothetical protein
LAEVAVAASRIVVNNGREARMEGSHIGSHLGIVYSPASGNRLQSTTGIIR